MRRHLKIITISLFAVIPPFAYAQEVGTLSVFMLKSGKPLVNNEIIIDGKRTVLTDADGSIKVTLAVGKHQVEIFGKSTHGKNLGYFKKPVTIKEEKDTQIVASFTMSEPEVHEIASDEVEPVLLGVITPEILIDTPVGKIQKDKKKENELKVKGKGTLNGRVLTSDKKAPIEGARVFVKGTAIDTRTDASGNFTVQISADTKVSISVVHSAYSSQTISDINVAKDGSVFKSIELTPASLELEEFVVLAPKVEGSIADIMAEEKESSAIANILGAEEFAKKGDSNAASALKRVTGITLVGGKSIYVRGLGERYSNIEMNSMPLPSPDPTKRTVPLDIFPSSVIGSLKVQKSASADIPSSFGGGYIDIRTKDVSDENFIKVSLGTSGNSNTGKNSDNYFGSDSDWMGYDNGYRAINNELLGVATITEGSTVPNLSELSQEQRALFTTHFLDRNYNVQERDLPMGGSGSIEGAYNFEIKDDHKISVFANYGYDQDHKFRKENYNAYDYNNQTGSLYTTPRQFGTTRLSTSNYAHGGMLNIGYNYLDLLKIKYTKLYTRNAEKTTRIVEGILGNDDEYSKRVSLDWEERILDVDQINGEIDYELFNRDAHFDFGMEVAKADLYQPNNFKYNYVQRSVNGENTLIYTQENQSNLADRLTSKDNVYAFFAKNRLSVNLFSDDDYVDFGFNVSSKDRESRKMKFSLGDSLLGIIPDNETLTGNIESVYYQHGRGENRDASTFPYYVDTLFEAADYFDAEIEDRSVFTSLYTKPREDVEVTLGIKYVDFGQTIYQFSNKENDEKLIERIPESLTVSDVYPTVSVKYKYNDENHFDVAASRTYITPDLREFTSGSYFHPYEVAIVRGNPNLENTDIYNLDFKYSHYISDSENIKGGLFYKYLDKPIEDTQEQSGGLPVYSFTNSESAVLYGVELDGRKNFDFIDSSFDKYYFSGNFSYTNSDVTLKEEQVTMLTNNHRQLQGLSNIVMNATIGYDSEARNVALSYNKMGERIRKVGLIEDLGSDDPKYFPDTIEVPPAVLDLVWQEKLTNIDTFGIDNLDVKLKIGNILDEETVWKQGSNITKKFKHGQTVSFGISSQF
ncbi:MAG: Unknown protein [uncultured Sulfurovum sp.]|uniref:TonB-dependent receptor plug domain-containing protein n=1 Tax=uncultured Sulfurovum sp. TaxID=269237 RepID=A0A6S6TN34_9BACT|nr:MAG: Unknown protein [uncultured Sulfurovum sp.]